MMKDNWVKIVEAAYPIFMDKGYKLTTTAEVALSAEVNESTLFRTFKSKEALFHSSIAYFAKKAVEIDFNILEYSGDLYQDLSRMIENIFRIQLELIPSFRLLIKRSLVKESVLEEVENSIRRQENLFSHYLTGLQRRSLIKETDVDSFIEILFSYIFYMTFELLTNVEKDNFEAQLARLVHESTQYCMDALKIREVGA